MVQKIKTGIPLKEPDIINTYYVIAHSMLMFTRSASRCRYNKQTSLLLAHTRKTQPLWQ